MTVHDLITHRSGLVYGFSDTSAVGDSYRAAHVMDGVDQGSDTQAENVNRLAAQPLAFQPGHEWRYGLSIDVLGRVVEVASGMSLAEFFRQRIFQPLGMHDTGFRVPDEKLGRLATAYTESHDSLRPMAAPDVFLDGRLPMGRFSGPGTRGSSPYPGEQCSPVWLQHRDLQRAALVGRSTRHRVIGGTRRPPEITHSPEPTGCSALA